MVPIEEPFRQHAADIIWELDLCARLGVFPHEASNSEVARGRSLVVYLQRPERRPYARSLAARPKSIAVDKHTGEVVWRAIGPGEHVLHGQWSSPWRLT